jgi:hypothetical protein
VPREFLRRAPSIADMLDEHHLRGCGPALHAVYNDDIGAGMHGQLRVVEHARRAADLHVDRYFPVSDLAQLADASECNAPVIGQS